MLLTTPSAGLVTPQSITWVGDVTSFQSYGEIGGAAPFWAGYVPALAAVDQSGTMEVTFSNTGPNGETVTYQVVALPDFEERGSGIFPQVVAAPTNGLPVTTPHNRPLFASPYGAGGECGGAVALTTTPQTLIAAPPAGQLLIVDCITFSPGSTAGVVYVSPSNQTSNPWINHYVPIDTSIPPIQGPLLSSVAVDAWNASATGAIVRAWGRYVEATP